MFVILVDDSYTAIAEINSTVENESNFAESASGSGIEPIVTQVMLADEVAGQLYAYRLNRSAVILGTRDENFFGAAIGIGAVASGRYRCLAENDNVNSTTVVNIILSGKKCAKKALGFTFTINISLKFAVFIPRTFTNFETLHSFLNNVV